MNSIDLSSYSILTTDMTDSLTDLQNSGLNDINFTAIDDTVTVLSIMLQKKQKNILIWYFCVNSFSFSSVFFAHRIAQLFKILHT